MEHPKSLTRISIIFYHPYPEYGATEEQFSYIIRAIDKKENYKATLICPAGKKADKLADGISRGTVIRFGKFANGLNEISYLYRSFKNINPDIIHINELAPNAMVAANLAGIKRKILAYHTPTLDIKYNLKGHISYTFAFMGNWDVTTNSDSLIDFIVRYRRGIKRDKIKIIKYGVDRNKFAVNVDRQSMRKAFGISDDAFVIINVARLCRQKAQHLILEGVKLLPPKIFEKIMVLIAGEGEERPFLERRIKELGLSGKILLPGHRDDVANLLNMSDVFVLSSLFEGACVSLIESLAMGIPIIAPDIYGVRDTVEDGVTSLLVPPEDAKKIAQAIESLIKDRNRMQEMSVAGRERFKRYFTKERMIENFDSFYQKTN